MKRSRAQAIVAAIDSALLKRKNVLAADVKNSFFSISNAEQHFVLFVLISGIGKTPPLAVNEHLPTSLIPHAEIRHLDKIISGDSRALRAFRNQLVFMVRTPVLSSSEMGLVDEVVDITTIEDFSEISICLNVQFGDSFSSEIIDPTTLKQLFSKKVIRQIWENPESVI